MAVVGLSVVPRLDDAEIKITPLMIEDGKNAVVMLRGLAPEQQAIGVYRAMWFAKLREEA